MFDWERYDARTSPAHAGRARLAIPVELQSDGASFDGVTGNISQDGAFVATPRPPSVGERVTLRLAVPGHAVLLAVDAEVRWLRPSAAGGQPAGVGLSFIDPPFGVSLCIAWLLHCAG
jgi:uncharacterized protein (TIGR02266 family)